MNRIYGKENVKKGISNYRKEIKKKEYWKVRRDRGKKKGIWRNDGKGNWRDRKVLENV